MKTIVTTQLSTAEVNCSQKKARESCMTKGKKLLGKVKHSAETQTIWFFSDEKNFCQDQKHNTQNNRWLAYSPKDTPSAMQTKFSTPVIVSYVSREGDVMLPHFFREGLRLNSDDNVELLFTLVKPWKTRVANGRPYVWQQDSVPATSQGKVKNSCRRTITTTPVPMFGLRTPQILTPWIILYAALLRKMLIAVPELR